MKKQKLLSITILCLMTSFSYAQKKFISAMLMVKLFILMMKKDKKCRNDGIKWIQSNSKESNNKRK